jgi:hypothetical protein
MKNRTLYGFLLLGLSGYLLFYFINAYIAITYPYDIDYGEGLLLNQAKLISQGINIYKDISNYPYILAMYTPVYSFISAFFITLFGISFSIGRVISIGSAILIGLLIYKIIKEKTNRQIAFISSLIFFASPYIYTWTSLFRVDTLGLLFSLTGIYIVHKHEHDKKLYVAVLFFVLSIYTKQSFIGAPIAAVCYLFLRDKKLGTKFAGLFGVSVLTPFLITNYLTDGGFYLHTVVYNASPYSIKMAIVRYLDMIKNHMILFGFASTYAIYILYKREFNLFIIYFMISIAIAFTVGKAGAEINYFLELVAISCILTGELLGYLQFRTDKESLLDNLIVVLLLLQLVSFFHVPHNHWWRVGADKKNAINNFNKISSYLAKTDDNVLTQNSSFAVLNGKTYLFQPEMFTELQRKGLWDQSKFVNDITAERFPLLILYVDVNDAGSVQEHQAFFTSEMIDAIRRHYRIVEKIGGSNIYMPNSRQINKK